MKTSLSARFELFVVLLCLPVLLRGQHMEVLPVDSRLIEMPGCYVKKIPVAIVSYLPYDGDYIDPEITGVYNMTVGEMQARILQMSVQLKFALEEGSRFRGYNDADAAPYAGYQVVRYINVYEAFELGKKVGWKPDEEYYRPDYIDVMNTIDGQTLVESLGVREIWLWGWHYGPIEPAESNMSSPLTGDVSNSEGYNDDLPVYENTYVLYNYNYDRGVNEAIHNHGHQIERQLDFLCHRQDGNTRLFWEDFTGNVEGVFYPGRCGDTHHPPNAEQHYDYYNETLVWSDIEDWRPEGGQQKLVNRDTWGSIDYPWPGGDVPEGYVEAHWYMYWMQNFPGNGNAIPYGEHYMTNWWRLILDWDRVIPEGTGLYTDTPAAMEPCVAQIAATKDTTAMWTDNSAWVGGAAVDPMKLEGDVEINGFITREGDLRFKSAGQGTDTLHVVDTLVVMGTVDFRQNSVLKIGPNGVMIVTEGLALEKGLNILNTGVLAVKGSIDTKQDSEIRFSERLLDERTSSGGAAGDTGGDHILEEVYTPRLFHVPEEGSLLDAQHITGGPFSPRGPVEDSVYMKDPDPYPDDPDSELVVAIWNFFQEGRFPLPVVLQHLEAIMVDGCVQLSWTTLEEESNSHFVVQRSGDGMRYTGVGTVAGMGTSRVSHRYLWHDCSPADGDLYYRLQQMDVDGTGTIYGPVVCRTSNGRSIYWYPNPVETGPLHIAAQGLGAGLTLKVAIADATGRLIWNGVAASPGPGNPGTVQLEIDLPPGLYILRIVEGGTSRTGRLIVR